MEEWHEALHQADDSVVFLDVRNYYETRVGQFKQAVDRSFSDFKYFADKEAEGQIRRSFGFKVAHSSQLV